MTSISSRWKHPRILRLGQFLLHFSSSIYSVIFRIFWRAVSLKVPKKRPSSFGHGSLRFEFRASLLDEYKVYHQSSIQTFLQWRARVYFYGVAINFEKYQSEKKNAILSLFYIYYVSHTSSYQSFFWIYWDSLGSTCTFWGKCHKIIEYIQTFLQCVYNEYEDYQVHTMNVSDIESVNKFWRKNKSQKNKLR